MIESWKMYQINGPGEIAYLGKCKKLIVSCKAERSPQGGEIGANERQRERASYYKWQSCTVGSTRADMVMLDSSISV